MYIPNDNTQVTPSIDKNLKRLKTQFNEITIKNYPKLFWIFSTDDTWDSVSDRRWIFMTLSRKYLDNICF